MKVDFTSVFFKDFEISNIFIYNMYFFCHRHQHYAKRVGRQSGISVSGAQTASGWKTDRKRQQGSRERRGTKKEGGGSEEREGRKSEEDGGRNEEEREGHDAEAGSGNTKRGRGEDGPES